MAKQTLGDDIKLEGKWWLGGEPWIDGAVCMPFPFPVSRSRPVD